MPVTATIKETLQAALDKGDLNTVANILGLMKLGTMLTPLKKTFTGLTALATHDLTDAAHGSGPAALVVVVLRVVAGSAAAGVRKIGDVGATPDANTVTLSDDGKTFVFEDTVTGFVVEYVPRAAVDMTAPFVRV
jgi:hypothetical protein